MDTASSEAESTSASLAEDASPLSNLCPVLRRSNGHWSTVNRTCLCCKSDRHGPVLVHCTTLDFDPEEPSSVTPRMYAMLHNAYQKLQADIRTRVELNNSVMRTTAYVLGLKNVEPDHSGSLYKALEVHKTEHRRAVREQAARIHALEIADAGQLLQQNSALSAELIHCKAEVGRLRVALATERESQREKCSALLKQLRKENRDMRSAIATALGRIDPSSVDGPCAGACYHQIQSVLTDAVGARS